MDAPTAHKKGSRIPSIRKVEVDRWTDDGVFKMTARVAKVPKLSASKKCYIYSFEHGETPITVNLDGVDRNVRLSFLLYVKVPAPERRKSFEQEAKLAEARGEPKLW